MCKKIDYSGVDLTIVSDWVPPEVIHEENKHIPTETVTYLFYNRKAKGLEPIIKQFGKSLLCNRKGFGFWMAQK